MRRYDRPYDAGMRGLRDPSAYPMTVRRRVQRYDDRYEHEGVPGRVHPNRVTARYNRDYVDGIRDDPRPRGHISFGGDREERVGDVTSYRQPYTTIGGSRTWRGSGPVRRPAGFTPFPRDYGEYDRDFGSGRRIQR
jgi:hypothetical protein